jgi:hypothetical protein
VVEGMATGRSLVGTAQLAGSASIHLYSNICGLLHAQNRANAAVDGDEAPVTKARFSTPESVANKPYDLRGFFGY